MSCVRRIRAALRPTDLLARLGGDEFVVLLEDIESSEDASTIVRRVLDVLAAPHRADLQSLRSSASLGLALTSDPRQTPETLIAHADSAMYRAKRAGGGRYESFDPDTYAADRTRAGLRDGAATDLRTGLDHGEFALHYQPIVELIAGDGADGSGGSPQHRVYALEALARWQHPRRGLLAAQEFLPEIERAGLLHELGAWVVRTACQQLAAWDDVLGDAAPRRLFVNVSVAELTSPDFAHHLMTVLKETGVASHRVTFEITETGLIADPAAVTGLTALRALGFGLAIDDFGTGYSSLSRLVELPASTLKIDKSFTTDLPDRPAALAVVSAVLRLGSQLDRTVVVEGVEDKRSLEALRALGCGHVQGYLLGRPQPPHLVEELLVLVEELLVAP